MEEFLRELDERGVGDILDPVSYEYQGFTGDTRLFNALDDIVLNNKRVLIHGDSDPDGVFALKQVCLTFDRVNYHNYTVHRYKQRSHVLTSDVVANAIYEKYDYMIILDSSTNDMYNIKRLVNFGVIPIILDHHSPEYSKDAYPSECIIINTLLENIERGEEFYRLSGGALTFCLMARYLELKKLPYKDLSAYALITLYSDCIDMTHKLNRGIYYMATSLPKESLPIYVKHFMRDYNVFSRRFIEFSFVPKINALFRAEELELLNSYLLDEHTFEEYSALIDRIIELYEDKRKMINIATDSVKRENMNNIVVANLSNTSIPIHANKLYNYTGLVANGLSSEYGKPCIVMCDTGTGIKASFRDLLSRNYLPKFKQFCNAAGHGAAFAISMDYTDYNQFMWYLREKIDKKFFILGVTEPIEIDCSFDSPDPILLENMALYNEFSGISVPIAILSKRNNLKAVHAYSNTYNYRYSWSGYTIDSSYLIPPGAQIKIKPIKTQKLKLVVYNRNVML